MKFKTNAKCAGCSSTIIGAVRNLFPAAELSLDLTSPDKILLVGGVPEDAGTAARIAEAVAAAGFSAALIAE